jgi:hypothetical protein
MRIINWQKINGFTYKGYVLGRPTQSPDHKVYSATIYDLNKGFNGSSDMWIRMKHNLKQFHLTLSFKDGLIYCERTEILTYENVKTLGNFIKCYEVLIDYYEYKKKK